MSGERADHDATAIVRGEGIGLHDQRRARLAVVAGQGHQHDVTALQPCQSASSARAASTKA